MIRVSILSNVKVLFYGLLISSWILFSCKSSDEKIIKETFKEVKLQTKTNNQYIYFNVWNTKCVPCVREMPDIDSLAYLYRNKVDFVFLTEEDDLKVNNFLDDKNIQLLNCTVFNDKKELINTLCARGQKSLSYPLHFIVNKDFEIIHTHSGAISGNIFDPILVSALKKLD